MSVLNIWVLLFVGLFSGVFQLQAQTPGLNSLSLETLQNFKPANKSWSISGDAYVNRAKAQNMKLSSGQGLLSAAPKQGETVALETIWNHQDIDMELEFMLSNESAAAISLQGNYKVALADSWKINSPSKVDAGGLPALKENGNILFNGIPPSQNAARAPGTWQKLFISFSAAVFDQNGKILSNPHFNEIRLNNTLIHQNIDLPASSHTASKSPLVFEVSNGPVAFKNIGYVLKKYKPVLIKNIQYQYFEEKLKTIPDFKKLTEKKSGNISAITWSPALNHDGIAMLFTGKITVPETTDYTFTLVSLGGSRLTIDGTKIIDHLGKHDHDGKMSKDQKGLATLPLSQGEHDFSLAYYKNTWAPLPILGLFIQGKGNYLQALHAPGSMPEEEAVGRILLQPSKEPYIQRGFMNFNGKKKMYCVAVGDPSKINYAYDLSTGTLLKVWKGHFIDATPMWHERGSQIVDLPTGGITFVDEALTAELNDINTAMWPDSIPENTYQFKGYLLNEQGQPEFTFAKGGMTIKDILLPNEDGTTLTRKLRFDNASPNSFHRIASAKKINKMPDGTYSINDKEYFIEFARGLKPLLRAIDNKMEILLPLSQSKNEISYTLIW
jgi:hypothetical protein